MSVPRFHRQLFARLHLLPRMIEDTLKIAVALLVRRPQVLHVTALYWRSIYREAFAVWLAKRLGIAVFYDIRAGTFEKFVMTTHPLIRRLLVQPIITSADAVGVQGKDLVCFIRQQFDREAIWIPNCVLAEDLNSSPKARLVRPRKDQPFRLAFLGYLIPEKGVDVLLEAARKLSNTAPVKVTLIGEVSDRFIPTLREFERLQDDNFAIEVTGRLELAEVLRVLRRQHVFVFLSRFFGEGHPNAVNEAMAAGLPVVASRNGFLEDVLDESCGVFVDDPRDAQEVCRVLERLYGDWDRLTALGAGAQRRVSTVFHENTVLSRTAEIYDRCARGAK